ncbi:hypothetical protein D3C87_266530 [compost metagenome]
MELRNKLTFTFIAEFKGGTYCSQIQSENLGASIVLWVEKIESEKEEIQYLSDDIILELKAEIKDEDNQPTLLKGLKNVWHTCYQTRGGSFFINIVQTQVGK